MWFLHHVSGFLSGSYTDELRVMINGKNLLLSPGPFIFLASLKKEALIQKKQDFSLLIPLKPDKAFGGKKAQSHFGVQFP